MGRSPCCAKEGLNRGAWTAMEDKILVEYIKAHGEGKWRNLPKRAGLKRCGKSCRLRWLNYLRPDIKRGNITPDEEELIIRLHKLLGNRWSLIAGRLPGRTDNEIKNYWNTNLSKRLNHHNNGQPTNHNQLESQDNSRSKNKAPQINNVKNSPQTIESTNVVRTKAVRCNKIFVNKELQSQPQAQQQFASASNNYVTSSVDNCSWARLEEEYNKISDDDFMMENLNMEDIKLISDLANTDFLDIWGFDNSESLNSVSDLSSESLEQPFMFSQELLEDWLGDHQEVQ